MGKNNYHHGDLPCALLKAAEAELAEHGLEKFSLRAVAKRAQVSHAAPAHHFKNSQGLLTALAASAYDRLVEYQEARQNNAAKDPRSQIIALGLGYIDFATTHPALFRLIFASDRPDRTDRVFECAALGAFNRLIEATRATTGREPSEDRNAMMRLMASWSVVHGLAELVVSGRAERTLGLSGLTVEQRDAVLASILDCLKDDTRG